MRSAYGGKLELQWMSVNRWLNAIEPELTARMFTGTPLDISIPDAELGILGNDVMLTAVLTNLVSNARDAMGKSVAVTAAAEGEQVRITVRDDGAGIPPHVLPRVFEPYFTTKKYGHSGIGLSFCQQVIRSHGGEIRIDSNPGQGTAVSVHLPLAHSG